jgi:hypothetical protein
MLSALMTWSAVLPLAAQTEPTAPNVRIARLEIQADAEELQVAQKFGERQVAMLQVNGEDKKPEERPKVKSGDRVKVLSATGALLGFFLVQKKSSGGSRPSQTVQVDEGQPTLNVAGDYRATNLENLQGMTSSGSALQPLVKTDSDAAFCGPLSPEDIQKGTEIQAVDKSTGEVKGKAAYDFVAVTGAWTNPSLTKTGVPVDLFVGVEGDPNAKVMVNVPLPAGLVFADGTTVKNFVKTVKDLKRPLDKIKSTEPALPGQKRTYAIPIAARMIQEDGKVGDWADGIVTNPRPTLDGYVPNARDISDLKATIDAQPADSTFDRSSGAFRVTPKNDLTEGTHNVAVAGRQKNAWIPLTVGAMTVALTSQQAAGCPCVVSITNVRARYVGAGGGQLPALDRLEVSYTHTGQCPCGGGVKIHVYWYDASTGTNRDGAGEAGEEVVDATGSPQTIDFINAGRGYFRGGFIGVYVKCHPCGATSLIWGDHPDWTPVGQRFGQLPQPQQVFHCGSTTCPGHSDKSHRCQNGVWYCGSTACPGHSSPTHRCKNGVWKCNAPNCPGHSSPDHRCKNRTSQDELYPDAVDMKDVDSWQDLRRLLRDLSDQQKKAALDATLDALKKRLEAAQDEKTKDWLKKKIKIVEKAIEEWKNGNF